MSSVSCNSQARSRTSRTSRLSHGPSQLRTWTPPALHLNHGPPFPNSDGKLGKYLLDAVTAMKILDDYSLDMLIPCLQSIRDLNFSNGLEESCSMTSSTTFVHFNLGKCYHCLHMRGLPSFNATARLKVIRCSIFAHLLACCYREVTPKHSPGGYRWRSWLALSRCVQRIGE